MSFIQSTIKCKNCENELNIATGTFGYGTPEKCPRCGYLKTLDNEPWWEFVSDGWHAKASDLKFFCTKVGCDHKSC